MTQRTMRLSAAAFVVTVSLAPAAVAAAAAVPRFVNCDAGRKISTVLRFPAGRDLLISVRGTCTENVVIDRDNVTIQKDPSAASTPVLNPLDPNQATS